MKSTFLVRPLLFIVSLFFGVLGTVSAGPQNVCPGTAVSLSWISQGVTASCIGDSSPQNVGCGFDAGAANTTGASIIYPIASCSVSLVCDGILPGQSDSLTVASNHSGCCGQGIYSDGRTEWNTSSSMCVTPIGTPSTPSNSTITLPNTSFTANYSIANGGQATCQLIASDGVTVLVSDACNGSISGTTPNGAGTYGYYIRAVRASTGESRLSNLFSVTVNVGSCPQGQYNDNGSCTNCTAGNYCPGAFALPVQCLINTYCPGGNTAPAGSNPPIACPPGTAAPAGSFNASQCVTIPTASFTSTPACSIPPNASGCVSTLSWTSDGVTSVNLTDCGGGFYENDAAGAQSGNVWVPYNAGCYQIQNSANNAVLAQTIPNVSSSCGNGSTWNGSICAPAVCSADQYWNGSTCASCDNGGCSTCAPVTTGGPNYNGCTCTNGNTNVPLCTTGGPTAFLSSNKALVVRGELFEVTATAGGNAQSCRLTQNSNGGAYSLASNLGTSYTWGAANGNSFSFTTPANIGYRLVCYTNNNQTGVASAPYDIQVTVTECPSETLGVRSLMLRTHSTNALTIVPNDANNRLTRWGGKTYGRRGQVLSLASSLSTTSRAVTMAMPLWVPIGSRCLRSPVTISSARAATAAAIT